MQSMYKDVLCVTLFVLLWFFCHFQYYYRVPSCPEIPDIPEIL